MFFDQLINGLILGCMYALLAISFSLVLGILGMLNLAQGEVLMAGACVAYAATTAGFGFFPALFAAMAAGGLLSLIIEFFCFPLPKSDDPSTPVVTTIAMSLILQNFYTEIWGSGPLKFPEFGLRVRYEIFGISLNAVQILLIAGSLFLMAALSFVIAKTWTGREIRTVAQSKTAARVVGIDIPLTIVKTFLLSGLIAGIAGVMAGLVFSHITPFVGSKVGNKAMVAMVIGGAGSMKGAMISGVLLGIVEILSVAYLGVEYREIIVFLLLILFLWFRPEGLFKLGKVERI